MPIHRLGERPTRRGILADLTCDSDGIVDHFIDVEEVQRSLDLHPVRAGEPYYLGMFLGGAYQEILGDLHNLFGDTNAVHVRLEDYGYSVANVIKGDAIDEVFGQVAIVRADAVTQRCGVGENRHAQLAEVRFSPGSHWPTPGTGNELYTLANCARSCSDSRPKSLS